jgi:hypothetical protein
MKLEDVNWKPAKIGGALFVTNKFELKNEATLIIGPSDFFKIVVPIVVMLLSTIPFLSNIIFQKSPSLIIILVVVCFDIIMLIVYLKGLKVVELNKKNDTVKKGFSVKTAKIVSKISQIEIIQIIEEPVPNKQNYSLSFSYEINLVFNDQTRLNLTDHSVHSSILDNVKILKQFIRCPIYTRKHETNEIIEVV